MEDGLRKTDSSADTPVTTKYHRTLREENCVVVSPTTEDRGWAAKCKARGQTERGPCTREGKPRKRKHAVGPLKAVAQDTENGKVEVEATCALAPQGC